MESETWNYTTTAVVTVSMQDCVFHYYCYLLQAEYQSSSQTASCLVTSEFASLFPVLASYVENGYSVNNNTLLQYSVYFMEESVRYIDRTMRIELHETVTTSSRSI